MKPFYFQNDDGGIERLQKQKRHVRGLTNIVSEDELTRLGFFEGKMKVKNLNRMMFKKFYGVDAPKVVKKSTPIMADNNNKTI